MEMAAGEVDGIAFSSSSFYNFVGGGHLPNSPACTKLTFRRPQELLGPALAAGTIRALILFQA